MNVEKLVVIFLV